jgi:hypothetical protein
VAPAISSSPTGCRWWRVPRFFRFENRSTSLSKGLRISWSRNSIQLKTRVYQQDGLNGVGNVKRRDVTSYYVLFRPTFVNCPFILQRPMNSSRSSFLTLSECKKVVVLCYGPISP